MKTMLLNLNIIPTAPDSTSAKALEEVEKNIETVSATIKNGRIDELLDKLITWAITFGGKLLLVLVIFFIGRWLIRKLLKVQDKIWERRKMDITLQGFLRSLFAFLAYTGLVILIINVAGFQTVSLAALIASAGLAIGLAVKDNLANFAGGVMILLSKPFHNGDFIEAQGLSGTVKTVGILYTMLTSADNKTIYIPNGPLSTGSIINYNSQGSRRGEIVVNLNYDGDSGEVKRLLLELAGKHPKVLRNPEPFARLTKINDSSLEFSLRFWTQSADYWNVIYDLNEEIYKILNEKALNIQMPQMTVHLEK